MTNQEAFDKMLKDQREAQVKESGQLSLGDIIERCEEILKGREGECYVVFDFEYARPQSFDSWRGIYEELAIGFEFGGDVKLSEFIESAKDAVGQTFSGYKGGEFTMTKDTPVWVANYGNSGGTAVVGVLDEGWQAVLLTGYKPV